MPTYVEVETLDGHTLSWVADDEVIAKLVFLLGEPDAEVLQDSAA